jgi:hypothetical protein
VLPPIYNWLLFKRTAYAITNRRVIIQKGVIGRDFDFIDFDKITQANVNVGIFDKLFKGNTGTILVSTPNSFVVTQNGAAASPNMLSNITNPYEVYRYFEKVSYDVKTDIEYPNQLRPTINPGYQTSYNAAPATPINQAQEQVNSQATPTSSPLNK